jgi:MarR family transcriptional regulator, temperature-dependent positive regulator of motility
MFNYKFARQYKALPPICLIDMNTDMAVLDMAGHLIRRIHQQSTHLFAQRTKAAGFDLTPVQYAALEAVFTNPATDQACVAELIGYDRATIGGVIDRMEKKGWISRVVSAKDRRARELSLTTQGHDVRLALQPIVQALQDEILTPLSEEDQQCFINLARQVVWPASASPTDASVNAQDPHL